MTTASIIYWYDEEHMPLDGGGQRALAWKRALESQGIDTRIHAIHPGPLSTGRPSVQTRVKRALAPMPLSKHVAMPRTDIVVATVPGSFPSLTAEPSNRRRLVLDWMDLWSTNSRTTGSRSIITSAGGHLQGALWSARERTLPKLASANTFAGFNDLERAGSEGDVWLPTPVDAPLVLSRSPRVIRRLGFLANLNYAPNELSLRWFLRTYLSRFQDAGVQLQVAGFGSERVRAWGMPVDVLGPVDDLRSFYEGIDAAIVPIKHGGGIKVKAIEALMFGVPVIATPHVLAGFAPEFSQAGLSPISEFLRNPAQPLAPPTLANFSVFTPAAFNSSVRSIVDASLNRSGG